MYIMYRDRTHDSLQLLWRKLVKLLVDALCIHLFTCGLIYARLCVCVCVFYSAVYIIMYIMFRMWGWILEQGLL